MTNHKNIIFTGGGSGGHVVPAITIIKELIKRGQINLLYIGGRNSVERELIKKINIPYKAIFTGKLRRYFSLENMLDFFKFQLGIFQAFFYLFKFKKQETIIFSTGGFVGLPAVIAGGFLGIPIIIHEQTSRVGLANKIASNFAKKICVSFEDSQKFFPKEKTVLTGYPLNQNCYQEKNNHYKFNGFILNEIDRPIILITGGGNGSKLLNDFVLSQLEEIKDKFFIIHQVGKNYIDDFKKIETKNYLPVDFVSDLVELMKHASLVVSRAGAGTVMELMALQKPSVFVPLKIAQKNEQFFNAKEAQKILNSLIINEEDLNNHKLNNLYEQISSLEINSQNKIKNGLDLILNEIRTMGQ